MCNEIMNSNRHAPRHLARTLLCCLAPLLATGAALSAQDTAKPLSGYGAIRFGAVQPAGKTSDITEGGFCFGFDVETFLGKNMSFRMLTDYNFFGAKKDYGADT